MLKLRQSWANWDKLGRLLLGLRFPRPSLSKRPGKEGKEGASKAGRESSPEAGAGETCLPRATSYVEVEGLQHLATCPSSLGVALNLLCLSPQRRGSKP